MKTKNLFFLLSLPVALLGTTAMHAQQNILPSPLMKATNTAAHHPSVTRNIRNAQAARTTAAGSPLIGVCQAKYDGAAYTGNDSVAFAYSNGRGGGPVSIQTITGSGLINIPFDSAEEWFYNGSMTAYLNQARVTNTFNGNNNVLITTQQSLVPYLGTLRNTIRTINTYTGNNITTVAMQTWDTMANAWVNTSQTLYTYTGSNQTLEIDQTWSGAWVNTNQYIYAYDGNNNMTSETDQAWTSGSWVNTYLYTYDYTQNNNTSELVQQWVSNAWVNSSLYTYTYNAGNFQTSELDQSWTSGAWVNDNQDLYTYDGNNNQLSSETQSWNGTDWDNENKNLYTYDGNNNQITYTNQTGNMATWTNNTMDIYTYDANHNQLSDITQGWDNTNSVWVNGNRILSSFNDVNQILVATSDSWNVGGNIWQSNTNNEQDRFYYQTGNTSVASVYNKGGDVKVYPSPAGSIMNIDLNWDAQQSAVIDIYDASGRICRQWQVPAGNSYHAQVPVTQLPSGNYFVRIKGEQGQLEKTITIAH